MSLAKDLLDVSLIGPKGTLFEGKAHRVVLPGQQGVFEVLPHHKPLLSLLLPGEVLIDEQSILIRRGIVKVFPEGVQAIVETA